MSLSHLPSDLVFDIFSFLDFTLLKPLIFQTSDHEFNLDGATSSGSGSGSGGSGSSSSSLSTLSSTGHGFIENNQEHEFVYLPIHHLFGEEHPIDRFGMYMMIRFIESVPAELLVSDSKVNLCDVEKELRILLNSTENQTQWNYSMDERLSSVRRIFQKERAKIRIHYLAEKYLKVTITNENILAVGRHYRQVVSLVLEEKKRGLMNSHNLYKRLLTFTIPFELIRTLGAIYPPLIKPLKNIHDVKAVSKNPYFKTLLVVVNSLNECGKYFNLINRGLYANISTTNMAPDNPLPVDLFVKFWKILDNPLTYDPLVSMVVSFTGKSPYLIEFCNKITNLNPPMPPTAILTQQDHDRFLDLIKLLGAHSSKCDRYRIFDELFFEAFEGVLKKTLYFKNNTMKLEDFANYVYQCCVL